MRPSKNTAQLPPRRGTFTPSHLIHTFSLLFCCSPPGLHSFPPSHRFHVRPEISGYSTIRIFGHHCHSAEILVICTCWLNNKKIQKFGLFFHVSNFFAGERGG
jgi:hypothetical protein